MRCSICGMEIDSIDEAVKQGWIPYFYDGETEHEFVCPGCSGVFLELGKKIEMDPAKKSRYAERSSAERINSTRKDNYGGRNMRVKGPAKVMTHLMFGLIVVTAMQLVRLLL